MGNSFIPGPNMGGGIIYIFSLLIYNKNPLVICPISDCFLVGIFKKKIEAMNSDFIIFLKQQKFCRKVRGKLSSFFLLIFSTFFLLIFSTFFLLFFITFYFLLYPLYLFMFNLSILITYLEF